MKKVISLFLALLMCLMLCACGGDGFDEEYAAMIERVEKLNDDTSKITAMVYTIWSNVGVSNFGTFFGALRKVTDGTTLDSVTYSYLGAAACCLFPSKYWDDNTEVAWNLRNATEELKYDAAAAQSVLDAAIEFNALYDSLVDRDEALSDDMKAFKEKHEKKHENEVSNLRDWVLETSMYVDFAVDPSGSLFEYGNSITSYEENLSRFNKTARAY